ncbi:MAG TPA: MBL fold metallo-hydrolase [Thermaerobacter sp.]
MPLPGDVIRYPETPALADGYRPDWSKGSERPVGPRSPAAGGAQPAAQIRTLRRPGVDGHARPGGGVNPAGEDDVLASPVEADPLAQGRAWTRGHPERGHPAARQVLPVPAAALEVAGLTLEVVYVPGHSPGHVMLRIPDRGWIFTGDHVLPRAGINVWANPVGPANPMGAYLDNLAAVAALDAARGRTDWVVQDVTVGRGQGGPVGTCDGGSAVLAGGGRPTGNGDTGGPAGIGRPGASGEPAVGRERMTPATSPTASAAPWPRPWPSCCG